MFPFTHSPILASFLALLLAIGNVPAWMHCGGCGSAGGCESTAEALGAASSHSGAGCCGRLYRAKPPVTTDSIVAIDPSSDSSHDPNTCVSCRVAVFGTAVVLSDSVAIITSPILRQAVVAIESAYLPISLGSDRSRGPPVA
jgi:hypothetical protein